MDWNNDLEISSKKNYLQQLIPRLGRRAGQNVTQDDQKFNDDLENPASVGSSSSIRTNAPPVVPPRTRKTGWGDELKSGKVRTTNLIEQERSRKVNKEEIHDDIPVIPDIDEILEENVFAEVANAPSVGINRVAAYKELDTDLLKNASFAFLDDINLSLLTEKLYPEKLIKEPDEVWTWDQLFNQISSEINCETQKKINT
ncbi:hypothetical protein PV328_009000 [Microctonus aethiopoides]|uniref:Intraflagellar transport protein 43 homolog n=1 Tax=Microctonus aethiopoides TaxID=144406 RepID=A0AA39KRK7_9HYME|nr:hypothetical protein PV328_009000 [Microctonus aethiopoides]